MNASPTRRRARRRGRRQRKVETIRETVQDHHNEPMMEQNVVSLQVHSGSASPGLPKRRKRRAVRRNWRNLFRKLFLRLSHQKRGYLFPVLLLISTCMLYFGQHGASNALVSLEETSTEFQALYDARRKLVRKNQALYQSVYENRLAGKDRNTTHASNRLQMKVDSSIDFSRESYGFPQRPCSVTVVFLDPRLGFPMPEDFGTGEPAWFSLESVSAFAPKDACILIQTSWCRLASDQSETAAKALVRRNIYRYGLPLFQNRIRNGGVRVTFMDHEKYNLDACDDYGHNPSPAFMNYNYWNDEFIDGVDSVHILLIQDDAVLCHPMLLPPEGGKNTSNLRADAQRSPPWTDYAYIGAPWPKEATALVPEPMEGACRAMPARWKMWLLPQARWLKQQQKAYVDLAKRLPKPKEILPASLPHSVCDDGRGPIGNGGFSWRSRTWMKKVIETCPHAHWSGLEGDDPPACKVIDATNEDLYFGTVLQALGAPLPLAYEASLFAVESMWPQDVKAMYGNGGIEHESRPFISWQNTKVYIPQGIHKPWWYHSNELLRSEAMADACPFLPYIFSPEMSRWTPSGMLA